MGDSSRRAARLVYIAVAAMSAHTQRALEEFRTAMNDPEHLVAIHRSLNKGPGRRWREMTLNRAVVVLTVAAWQAYIEDLARAIVRTIQPAQGAQGYGLWQLVKAATESALGRFNTPNADNVKQFLSNVGFDPYPHWSWGGGPSTVTPGAAAQRINDWLRVRHTVAHGDELPAVAVIDRTAGGNPTLTRENAETCMQLFTRLAETTTIAANNQFP
jgi:hypothetical protein